MSATDGARSADDPVLSGALSEMASEGSLDATASLDDLGTDGASQASGDASAADAAALPPTGDDGSSPVDRTAADAAGTSPDPGADSAADPLAGTEPFTYTVNGETRTLDGVYRVPGEGLLVPEDKVASLQQLAERAEILDRVSREVTDHNASYERLSAWTVTDAQGKEHTLTGLQGLEAMRVDSARVNAAVSIIDGLLSDPAKLLGLLAQDDKGQLVVDPSAVETLQMRIQLAANAAEQRARGSFANLRSPAPATSTGPANYAASAPKIIESAAGSAYNVLTAEDRNFLASQIGRYVRAVTEEDRRWDPSKKIGAPIVDAEYAQLVQRTAAQRADAKRVAEAAERAGKFNGGTERGRQPAKPATKPAAPVVPPKSNERQRPNWDGPLEQALQEMAIPR